MPVTNAFLSSKLVSKLACRQKEERIKGLYRGKCLHSLRCVTVPVRASLYLVHDGGRGRLDAWLLVREGQLLQQVHVGQGVLQGHVGRHGNKVLLTQNPTLGEK